MQLAPGDTFGRYTIGALLGQGGMGRVYQARDTKLERPVALKLLRLDAAEDAGARQRASARLLHEARAAALLQHANAVAIYDVGEVDGVAFIAMELVDGVPLRARVGDPSVRLETKIRWLGEIAQALAAAHARGLIHRDVKPENAMVRSDGVIKVLDFGIARMERAAAEPVRPAAPFAGPASSAGQLSTTAAAGTPRYMAPEQLLGEPFDARVDQFAWGVLAYELLTGLPPWATAANPGVMPLAAMTGDEPAPREPLDALEVPHVAKVVLRALAKDKADRFASMDELVASLEPPPAERPGRSIAYVAVAVALGSAAVALTSASLFAAQNARSKARSAASSSAAREAEAAPASMRVIDLPVPGSANAEAKTAFVTGLHALREGSIAAAVRAFARATDLDPSMAAAHVRIAVHGLYVDGVDAHAHFGKARELHGLLSPRDEAILWATEPFFLTTPPDDKEETRRIRDIAARWPLDAEIQLWAATRETESTAEIASYERVLAIDPEFALALTRLANVHQLNGNYAGSLAALDRCLTAAPSSKGCLAMRVGSYEELGRCIEMERDARLLDSVSGTSRSSDSLARVLYANGAPAAAVRAALERKWAATAEGERDATEVRDEAHLAILAGDFVAGERGLRDLAARVERSAAEDEHADATMPLVELELEMGRGAQAARIADAYLSARPSWKSAGAWSPVPQLYAIAVHGGLRTEQERATARAAWLELWKGWEGPIHAQSWVLGWAFPATTGAEAAEALSRAPEPLPRVHSNQFHREGIEANGRVLLLAGHAKDAVPALQAATATCSALEVPIEHTRAFLHLGEALEATGDVTAACASYAVVLDRWGSAKPRSVSADRARARRRALACR